MAFSGTCHVTSSKMLRTDQSEVSSSMIFINFDISNMYLGKSCVQKLYAHLCFPILKSTRLFQIKAIIIKKLQNSGRCGVAEEVLHKEFQTVLHRQIRLVLILPWSDVLMNTTLLHPTPGHPACTLWFLRTILIGGEYFRLFSGTIALPLHSLK